MRFQHHHNKRVKDVALQDAAKATMADLSRSDEAITEISSWPGYHETPLRCLSGLAGRLGVASIHYKDESTRFGPELGSFKALGAPYAVFRLLVTEVKAQTGTSPSSTDLRNGKYRPITENVTVCVATDGNQGRGLAWGAQQFGCRCVVYVHEHVSAGRVAAIEGFGATVVRVPGEYEDSVARVNADAAAHGWHIVTSTACDGYRGSPRDVMLGYMTMIEESLRQLPKGDPPTHVFMQGGVGSIAAAVFTGYFGAFGERAPRFILVEPKEADCLFQSAQAETPTPAAGTLDTIMAGLACREVSPSAWAILQWLTSDFVTIEDRSAEAAMRELLEGHNGDPKIVAGESAVGGLAALMEAKRDDALRRELGLNASSRVVLFGCEGATDPDIYQRIAGVDPRPLLQDPDLCREHNLA